MKQTLTLTGLVALSILYLIEVDYTELTVYNWIAFAIIALTFIPLTVSLVSRAVKRHRTRQAEKQGRRVESEEKEK